MEESRSTWPQACGGDPRDLRPGMAGRWGGSGRPAVELHCPLQAQPTQDGATSQPATLLLHRPPGSGCGWMGSPPTGVTPFPQPRLALRNTLGPLCLVGAGGPKAWASPLLRKLLQVPLNPPVQRVEAFDVQQVQHLHLEGFVQKTALR